MLGYNSAEGLFPSFRHVFGGRSGLRLAGRADTGWLEGHPDVHGDGGPALYDMLVERHLRVVILD